MHPYFKMAVETLHPSFERLVSMTPCSAGVLPRDIPKSGVYLFSEAGQHLYAGRSRDMRSRYRLHTRPSALHNQASFAFLLAKEKLGITQVSYRPDDMSRSGLSMDPVFITAFSEAKSRVYAMEFRFVEEVDSIRQTLLEIYAAVALSTPYNSFKTH